tara:strand:+ start:421 stop:870 length:450 start_codon:yes stop_codon:yes gene_type:complete
MKIKTFRGLLADGAVERIRLSTNDGLTGYKVKKFEIIAENNGTTDYEHTVKLHLQNPIDDIVTTVSASVNFNDPLLLGVAYTEGNNSSNYIGQPLINIFDQMKFNQDIYVSHVDSKGALNCNYYLELEQVKLDINEATVATLKDMRGRE